MERQKNIPTKRVRDAILKYHIKHGYMPSFREIAEECNIKSVSTVAHHFSKLQNNGFLESDYPADSIKKPLRMSGIWQDISVGNSKFVCSICEGTSTDLTTFCPHCGGKMDY